MVRFLALALGIALAGPAPARAANAVTPTATPALAPDVLVPIAYRTLDRGPLAGVRVLTLLDLAVIGPPPAGEDGDPAVILPEAGPLGAAFEVPRGGAAALVIADGALLEAAGGATLARPDDGDGPITGFALDASGGATIVAGASLGVPSAGGFLPVLDLPGPGFEVAALSDGTLVLWRPGASPGALLAVREARAARLAEVAAPIDAVAVSGRRILVAAGGAIYAASPGEPTTIVFAAPGLTLDGLAIDPTRGTILASGGGHTYAILGGAALPILDGTSGPLRCAVEAGKPALYVLDRERRLLLRVGGIEALGRER